jgi:hypothetical protein
VRKQRTQRMEFRLLSMDGESEGRLTTSSTVIFGSTRVIYNLVTT